MLPYQPNDPRPRPDPDTTGPKPGGTATHIEPAPGGQGREMVQNTTVQPPPMPGIDARVQPWTNLPVEIQAAASMMLEYIASASPRIPIQFGGVSGLPGAGSGIHTLPLYIDELERDFGTDIYLKIALDAQVSAADATLRYAVLDREPAFLPGADPKKEKDPLKLMFSQRVHAFVEAVFDHMEPKLPGLCWELLEGMGMGYKLAELVFEEADLGKGEGMQTVYRAIKTKPQESVSFLVDLFNNVLGYVPRAMATGMFATIFPEGNGEVPGLVPVEKVVRFTWRPRNGDPRGTSLFRPAYIPWRFKIGLYPAYEAFLARFAQPSAALELQGQDMPMMLDADGVLTRDPSVVIFAMLSALRNFQAGGAIVAPVGQVKLLETMNQGQSYLQAFGHVNKEIVKSILLQEMTTESGKYGTQALGAVHQDTQGTLVAYAKQELADCIERYIIRPLVFINYGPEGLKVAPHISFGETEQQDFATVAGAAASLNTAKMLVPSQFNDIFDMLHLPTIPQEIIDMMMAAFEQQLQQAAQPPAPPMGVGPDGQPLPPGQPGGGAPGQPGQPGEQPAGLQNHGGAATSSLVPQHQPGGQPPAQGGFR
jgi:hypothetical protein